MRTRRYISPNEYFVFEGYNCTAPVLESMADLMMMENLTMYQTTNAHFQRIGPIKLLKGQTITDYVDKIMDATNEALAKEPASE